MATADELLNAADKVVASERNVEKAKAYDVLHDEWFSMSCQQRDVVSFDLDEGSKKSERGGSLAASFGYENGELTSLNFLWSQTSSLGGMGSAHLTETVTLDSPFADCKK